MRRVWNLAGKYDLTKILLPVIAVMIGLALLTGGKNVPTPVPDNEVILVIPPGGRSVDDLHDPNGFWVESREDRTVKLLHEGDAPVKARVSYWKDRTCIQIDSVLPLQRGDELIAMPQPAYCDGVYVQVTQGNGLWTKELDLLRK
jgi:hypothetical protein